MHMSGIFYLCSFFLSSILPCELYCWFPGTLSFIFLTLGQQGFAWVPLLCATACKLSQGSSSGRFIHHTSYVSCLSNTAVLHHLVFWYQMFWKLLFQICFQCIFCFRLKVKPSPSYAILTRSRNSVLQSWPFCWTPTMHSTFKLACLISIPNLSRIQLIYLFLEKLLLIFLCSVVIQAKYLELSFLHFSFTPPTVYPSSNSINSIFQIHSKSNFILPYLRPLYSKTTSDFCERPMSVKR